MVGEVLLLRYQAEGFGERVPTDLGERKCALVRVVGSSFFIDYMVCTELRAQTCESLEF